MTREELVAKIKTLTKDVYKGRLKADVAAAEYDELTKFPELKKVIVDLLTADLPNILSSNFIISIYFSILIQFLFFLD